MLMLFGVVKRGVGWFWVVGLVCWCVCGGFFVLDCVCGEEFLG